MRNELFTSLCEPYCPRDCGVRSKPTGVQGRQRWWIANIDPQDVNFCGGSWVAYAATHPSAGKDRGCWAYHAAGPALVKSRYADDVWVASRGTTWELAPEPVVAEPSKAACTHGPWVMDNTSKWRCLGCGYISQSHAP